MLKLDDETDDLDLISDAIVVPPRAGGKGKWQPSGVLDRQGNLIKNSISWSSSTVPINGKPDLPLSSEIEQLSGTYLFGGISYGHFGHFITESLTRIWAIDEVRDQIDGLIFTPKNQMKDNLRPFEVYQDIVDNLGMKGFKIICPAAPLQVENLYVPKQGFGLGDLTGGSRKFVEFINRHAGANVKAEGASKIYISRSKLPAERGGILGESLLERFLIDEGFEVFHPQKETKYKQLAQYKAANVIVSVDCSPLHLVGYVGHSNQTVAIIKRRDMEFGELFARQLRGFKGIDCYTIDELKNDWLPKNTSRPSRSSFGEIDFPATYAALKEKGLIKGTVAWPPLTLEQRNADLHRIEQMHSMSFKPFKEDTTFETSIAG